MSSQNYQPSVDAREALIELILERATLQDEDLQSEENSLPTASTNSNESEETTHADKH